MKETDLMELPPITVAQARYVRRKFHEWAKFQKAKAKRDRSVDHYQKSEFFSNSVMLEGIASAIEERLKMESDDAGNRSHC